MGHRCRNNFRMKLEVDKGRPAVCDAYVTDNQGNFWKIREVMGDDSYVCVKVNTSNFYTGVPLGMGSPLPWHKVGVMK